MIDIKHLNHGQKGSFDLYYEGTKAGNMTYTSAGKDKIIIDHTEVSPEYGGKGLAKELVFAGAAYARENGKKIIPLCTYAKSTFEKHRELHDVLA
ncbi:GNAT family N-acetyltransferase [Chryseobacterium sp. 6424]|uniref:GNAT family N-acetyltransferase n=1 Tax=Chryseobacterium sp. 6424 TaxID=2039166 RepID=UPI0016262185